MNTSNQNITRVIVIAGMMLLAAFTRLIPHPANFTAVLAIALFGGAKFKKPALAILIPLVVMLLTDLTYSTIRYGSTDVIVGFYSLMPLVYSCIAVTSLIGIYISKKQNMAFIFLGSVVSSTLFFLVTNAGVWYHSLQYAQNAQGLTACYAAGIPFYGNQLLGDLFFNAVLFGAFSLVSKRVPVLKANFERRK